MKINSISKQNFCAKPCDNTRYLLAKLESNKIDTKPITELMKKNYVGAIISTNISQKGNIRMDLYTKIGDHDKALIKSEDDFTIDSGTYKLNRPEEFAQKLYFSLIKASELRSNWQKNLDKVNGAFYEC